ncbi:MAG: class I SAM-dependent methyltransferase [Planctomycetes bacterium]|nr:class I SAM-dependent methyltransferase [Planctomycetota bacterium]
MEEWGLSPEEAGFVDRQQGVCCVSCGCNLRSIALGGGICDAVGHDGTLRSWADTRPAHSLLEVNAAGGISPILRSLEHADPIQYPKADMRALPRPDASFDLVVHSDTLEHIEEPGLALSECLRVLRPGGWLVMTVPTLPGRLTRSRAGMAPSYHGGAGRQRADHLVHTEFGADVWVWLARAGFERIGLRVFAWPSGLCWLAQRPGRAR